MYQKSDATVDGEAETAKFRLDNNANLVGKSLSVKNAELICESYSNMSINVKIRHPLKHLANRKFNCMVIKKLI